MANLTETLSNKSFELNGFLRINNIVGSKGYLPFSRSTFYSRIRNPNYPDYKPPIKFGRISAWHVSDILAIVENATNERGAR